MKYIRNFTCLAGALLLASSAMAADKETITRSFEVKPGGKLHMNVDRGSIRVSTSDSDKVDVKVVREARGASESAARDVYEKHKIEMSQEGDMVSVMVDRPEQRFRLFSSNPFNKLRVEYTISVPKEFDLDLRTAGGNIDVTDLKGDVQVNTAGGNLTLGSIEGPVRAETSGGNISVDGGKGKSYLRTSGGDVRMRDLDGDLIAKTSGGNISIERVSGRVQAETSGGDIRVQETSGAIYAHTSGGNVSAQIAKQPDADCALATSGGNVSITLPAQIAADLNAKTSGGSIRSDFEGEMNKQRTKLAAQINGGGPDILLETSGGNVEIRRK